MKARVQLTEAAQEEHLEALPFYRGGSLAIAQAFEREFKHNIGLLPEYWLHRVKHRPTA